MSRRIWILNHYASSMFFDHGGRHYWFAKYLKHFGDSPVIFCCNAKHNGDGVYYQDCSLWNVHYEDTIQVPFVFVRGRAYEGNGIKRILNMIDFYRNVKIVALEYGRKYGSPDIIYASSVHPLALVAGIQLAEYFHVKCICEIRDLWPEAFVSYGMIRKSNPLLPILYFFEKKIYKKANYLIFTMAGGYDYIKEKRWERDLPIDKIYHINNGVDLKEFDYNKSHYSIDDVDLHEKDIFKVVYVGSIRKANNVNKLLDVAKIVKNSKVHFLIWGQGDEVDIINQRIFEEDILNVKLKGVVEKKYIPYIVNHADLNIIHYLFSPELRFGISFNKMFDYMAAGKPILTLFPCKYNPTVQVGAGEEVDNPTVENIAAAIERFAEMGKETYLKYCQNARKGAEQYDFKNLTQRLLEIMTK